MTGPQQDRPGHEPGRADRHLHDPDLLPDVQRGRRRDPEFWQGGGAAAVKHRQDPARDPGHHGQRPRHPGPGAPRGAGH